MLRYSACASFIAVIGAGLITMPALPAAAQDIWPSKPIRIVVPNPPGGLPDVLSRSLADRMREKLGQMIIVENRPGANAGIGAAVVTSSKPDGYTYIMSDNAIVNISHLLNKQLPFDRKELMPVVMISSAGIALGVRADLPIKSFADFVTHAKANPGKLNYGSIGVGSYHHLSMEAIQAELGLKLNHIPYKGSGESVTALRAGNIEMVFASFAALQPAVKAGQALIIAQTTRMKDSPDVPAITESIPQFDLPHTQTLFARAGTPIEIADKMAAAVREIVKFPEIVERFKNLGIEATVRGPGEARAYIDKEATLFEKIVKATGVKPE